LRNERGFALVITLLITALLVALSVEFVDEVFVDTSARQNFVDGQQASIMAGSGVDLAIKGLQLSLAGRSPQYNSLSDLWAKPFKQEDEKGTLLVTIEDESSKVNFNLVSGSNGRPVQNYKIARRLIKNAELSLDLLDTLTDWVDDSTYPPSPAGAKNLYYNTLKPPYNVKGGNLETVEELRLVKGFTSAAYSKISQFVTVCDVCSQININTAPEEVIASLSDDMTRELAKQVVEYRKTTPFTAPGDLTNVPGMTGKIFQNLEGFPCVKGAAYSIRSSAMVKETTRTVEAVVREGDWQILYWREY
jgi:general secretion pathway protein K